MELPPAGPRQPVKRHKDRFYRLNRDVVLVLVDSHPPGRILGTQTFRAAGVFRILPTHTFRVAVTAAFFSATCILPGGSVIIINDNNPDLVSY